VPLRGIGSLSRFQNELDAHGVKGEHDSAVLGLLQDACLRQGMYITMHGLDVPAYPAGRLPQRQRTGSGNRGKELPPFLGQDLKQQRWRLEAQELPLRLSLESAQDTPIGVFAG
jgi:hypothetical protein